MSVKNQQSKLPLALFALLISAFAIGTTEFVIMGILPDVANDLHVSLSAAGLLVTGYALGVAIGGPIITAFTGQLPRKKLLFGLMLIFVGGNLLAAISPNIASAMNISSFNLANAGGAFLGGWIIDNGPRLHTVPWIAALVTAAGLFVTVFSWSLDKREASFTEQKLATAQNRKI